MPFQCCILVERETESICKNCLQRDIQRAEKAPFFFLKGLAEKQWIREDSVFSSFLTSELLFVEKCNSYLVNVRF